MNEITRVVQLGGGITSWATARIVVERYGAANTVLLFADVKAEHPDLYRFNDDVSKSLGLPITTVADGRTPIEANRDAKFLGNSRLAPCSKLLKQVPCREWLTAHCDPARTVLYVGIDAYEIGRVPGVRAGWAPWPVEFPLIEPPYYDKDHWLAEARRIGLEVPEMYRLGYPHNNCHGGCVRGGVAYWAHTLKTFPAVFAEHEQAESGFRTDGGKSATYLTETRDGVKRPLPLVELRHRVEAADADQPGLFDPYDWGGCGCFTDDPSERAA
ncbi:hypothetical protein [Streptomyces sp. NPDC058677]|uniref:hypothetical protein n=1 Tax=Streptomyces sp. NPDC058677 TaxID=3346594 RepID=UPI0036477C7A